jgi:hypothetical protein
VRTGAKEISKDAVQTEVNGEVNGANNDSEREEENRNIRVCQVGQHAASEFALLQVAPSLIKRRRSSANIKQRLGGLDRIARAQRGRQLLASLLYVLA